MYCFHFGFEHSDGLTEGTHYLLFEQIIVGHCRESLPDASDRAGVFVLFVPRSHCSYLHNARLLSFSILLHQTGFDEGRDHLSFTGIFKNIVKYLMISIKCIQLINVNCIRKALKVLLKYAIK